MALVHRAHARWTLGEDGCPPRNSDTYTLDKADGATCHAIRSVGRKYTAAYLRGGDENRLSRLGIKCKKQELC